MASGSPPPNGGSTGSFSELTSLIWSVADLLRGDYKQADYGKVILPSVERSEVISGESH